MKSGKHNNPANFANRDPELRKQFGSKGGTNSGKVRREKRAMRETVETLLAMYLYPGKKAKLEKIKSYQDLKDKNLTVAEVLIMAQIDKAQKGDTRAMEFLRDTLGERPDLVEREGTETEADSVVIINDFQEAEDSPAE